MPRVRLSAVEIEGYRSIKGEVTLHCDPRATVILGANDHGKTNLLESLLHLNQEHAFDLDRDLNWDCRSRSRELPRVSFDFSLNDVDRQHLRRTINFERVIAFITETIEREEPLYRDAEQNTPVADDALAAARQALELAESDLVAARQARKSEPKNEEAAEGFQVAGSAHSEARKAYKQAEIEQGAASKELHVRRSNVFSARALEFEVLAERDAGKKVGLQVALENHVATFEKQQIVNAEAVAVLSRRENAFEAATSEGDKAKILRAAERLEIANEKAQNVSAEFMNGKSSFEVAQKILELVTSGEQKTLVVPKSLRLLIGDVPDTFRIERRGVEGKLTPASGDDDIERGAIWSYVEERLPRVELIKPFESLPDAASREEIDQDEFSFLRGIFYYTGLKKEEWDGIFVRTDFTTKRLRDASDVLDRTLKQSWRQGKELTFRLDNDSKEEKIDLLVSDPAVGVRDTRASQRSSGFTHYFALKAILHARQVEAPAASNIWLFDEPGIYLHPDAQYDLLQVFEALAESNQLLYTTHSIFMINKNYPARHRLVDKNTDGTRLDGKPYVSHWRSAIDSLGLSLPGTILFASKVLLVEGDSDPILMNELIKKLIEGGRTSVDINPLSIMATGDSKHTDALVRILCESALKPKVAAIFDGDKGGRDREKKLKPLMKKYDISSMTLGSEKSIEDYLPSPRKLLVDAVSNYIAQIAEMKIADVKRKVLKSFGEKFGDAATGEFCGLAKWSQELGMEIAELDSPLSALGIARAYQILLADAEDLDYSELKEFESVVGWVTEKLDLPNRSQPQERVFSATD